MAPQGFEVFFRATKNDFNCREDSLICAIHWCLISNNYKCVGRGEEAPASLDRSEFLPDGWNSSSDYFTLLYVPNNSERVFLLKVIKAENVMLVNFMRLEDSEVADITLTTSEFVTDDRSSIASTYDDLDGLFAFLKTGILDKFIKKTHSSTAQSNSRTSTERQRSTPDLDHQSDPLRVGPRIGGGGRLGGHGGRPEWGPSSDPFSLGRADLDPLAAGAGMGGGMVMDPFRGGAGGRMPYYPDGSGLPGGRGLPPGAVPPGARFDPFGPGNPERIGGGGARADPDPDHLPPPGYDDMFQ